MKTLLSSKLKKIIDIYEEIVIHDSMGGTTNHWIKTQTISAMAEPLSISSSEIFQAMQFLSNNLLLFTIRFQKNITNKMHIKYRDKLYGIVRIINPQEKDITLQILAKEIINET